MFSSEFLYPFFVIQHLRIQLHLNYFKNIIIHISNITIIHIRYFSSNFLSRSAHRQSTTRPAITEQFPCVLRFVSCSMRVHAHTSTCAYVRHRFGSDAYVFGWLSCSCLAMRPWRSKTSRWGKCAIFLSGTIFPLLLLYVLRSRQSVFSLFLIFL